ncbi:hypothetical protein [Streptacidiphilus albus]|uniref:hypothetical protein n=2 Tax=Streptacidiphilus albus TaxID=105425 RepID=UPI001E61976C|nr:hypothetical protein [Streptacidiphilus albus]
MMLTQELTRPIRSTSTPAELSALATLMVEEEATVSDAPLYTPEDAGVGILALGLLLSPKPPKNR